LELLQRGQSVNRQRARRRNLGRVKTAALAISALGLVLAILYSLPVWKSGPPTVELSKNAEATDAYQQGVIWFHKNSIDAMAQAAKHFEHAIELDPNFAAAYAQLAHTCGWMDQKNRKTLERIRTLANKALSLDDKLLDARLALAWTKALLDHDWSGADKEYRHAIKLNPSSEDYLHNYATYLTIAGRTNEAVQQVEKALRLPSHSVTYLQNAEFVFLAAHQYDRAIKKIEEWIELEPSQQSDLLGLTTAYREKGDYLKAIEKEEGAALLQGEKPDQVKTKYDALRRAYNLGGALGYWQQLLDWSRNNENDPVGLAALYARVGKKGRAFHYLNLALVKTPTDLAFQININAGFDSLRSDRQFAEVLKKLGLGK